MPAVVLTVYEIGESLEIGVMRSVGRGVLSVQLTLRVVPSTTDSVAGAVVHLQGDRYDRVQVARNREVNIRAVAAHGERLGSITLVKVRV